MIIQIDLSTQHPTAHINKALFGLHLYPMDIPGGVTPACVISSKHYKLLIVVCPSIGVEYNYISKSENKSIAMMIDHSSGLDRIHTLVYSGDEKVYYLSGPYLENGDKIDFGIWHHDVAIGVQFVYVNSMEHPIIAYVYGENMHCKEITEMLSSPGTISIAEQLDVKLMHGCYPYFDNDFRWQDEHKDS